VGSAATDMGNAQIAWVDKTHELGRLVIQQGVAANGIAGRAPGLRKAGRDMRLVLEGRRSIASMTVGAAESNRVLVMRIVRVSMTAQAAVALCRRLGARLPQEIHSAQFRRQRVGFAAGRRRKRLLF